MFHMFRLNVSIEMMIYECLMLMLMLCKSSYAKLTPEVLHLEQYHCFGEVLRRRWILRIINLNFSFYHLPHLSIDWLDVCSHLWHPIWIIWAIKLGWLLGVVDLSHFTPKVVKPQINGDLGSDTTWKVLMARGGVNSLIKFYNNT